MNNLAKTRESIGVSQQTIATLCGWVSRARIGMYERGDRTPNVDDARALVKAFRSLGVDTSLDELFPVSGKRAVRGSGQSATLDQP